ncbi:formate/nitrite transporter family protein [Tessaracoccus sp. Z1128]
MDPYRQRLFPGLFFIDAVLEAADTKAEMSRRITLQYLQRAAMAGILIGLFYLAYFTVLSVVASVPALGEGGYGLGKAIGAFVFGWALVFIYYTKSELLTSNMMVSAIAVYHRRLGRMRGLRLLGLCFLGNALGGLVLAIMARFSTLTGGAVGEKMLGAVEVKLGYMSSMSGVGDLFVRAILCNLMINVAMLLVYNGFLKDSITMALTMVMSVFIFAFLGLEHSVANTILFTIVGFTQGVDVWPAIGNVAVALLGNFIGGGVLIGVYYAHVNDDRRLAARA